MTAGGGVGAARGDAPTQLVLLSVRGKNHAATRGRRWTVCGRVLPESPMLNGAGWPDCVKCAAKVREARLGAAAGPVPVAADVPTPSAATQNDEAQR